ncbi:MAG: DUF4300 family protein [Flavobacteriaceae bacterium]|nr:DUF4300 family protein [Flavobacteriaceae bacterium]
MKKILKNICFVLFLSVLFLTGCRFNSESENNGLKHKQKNDVNFRMEFSDQDSVQKKDRENTQDAYKTEQIKINLSNMGDKVSVEYVRYVLNSFLTEKNVDAFLEGVTEYNEIVNWTGLVGDFEEKLQPEYDVETMSKLWEEKKGDFIGTNCRLNTFLLLKDDIEIEKVEFDDSLLFLDNSALKEGNLLTVEEEKNFKQLFSKVKTDNTKDVQVHAKKMQEHFKIVKFSDDARMVSVVLHDNLDGDFLFIGHVGVMLQSNDGYLFVEKLAFDEPFQAIKFKSKQECYDYLYRKYEHYHDSTTSKPFIMDNDELVAF